ncbi:tetratricopeptide repeat protein [Agromyces salentinus]|uniref:Tetratricopeptide repeat protein n=1 Tax=Agromyces salentinus TaxID=269421 RepID=A0ABN2MNG8_9MICO|nr:tetratricopeptide repeat protein [Agromyces salentinus]
MTDPTPHAALRGAVDLSSLVQRPPQSGTGAPPVSPGGDEIVFQTDDAGFGAALELSKTVPVVVAVWASWSEPSTGLVETLERLVRARGGRLVLAAADADRSPQLVQAFQVQSVPTVVAVVAGQPVPLFAGVQPDEVIDQVFDQLLELASQHGVTGQVAAAADADPDAAEQAPAEPPLPPLHQEAYDAIERGDFAAAASAYKTAIAQDPRDQMAVAGLAQANLLGRLNGKTLDSIRNAAAAGPDDLQAQLDVADLDLSGGHVEDAFDRLLTMFPKLDADQKKLVRERLVELFEVVGTDDARVAVARRRLTNLLF